jgi:hypothetical protein
MDNLEFFFAWMQEPNPMLGGVVPLEMMERGYGNKLAQFIRHAIEDEDAAKAFRAAHLNNPEHL